MLLSSDLQNDQLRSTGARVQSFHTRSDRDIYSFSTVPLIYMSKFPGNLHLY